MHGLGHGISLFEMLISHPKVLFLWIPIIFNKPLQEKCPNWKPRTIQELQSFRSAGTAQNGDDYGSKFWSPATITPKGWGCLFWINWGRDCPFAKELTLAYVVLSAPFSLPPMFFLLLPFPGLEKEEGAGEGSAELEQWKVGRTEAQHQLKGDSIWRVVSGTRRSWATFVPPSTSSIDKARACRQALVDLIFFITCGAGGAITACIISWVGMSMFVLAYLLEAKEHGIWAPQ